MHTIGVLSLMDVKENKHINFLAEKGWAIQEVEVKKLTKIEPKIQAILIEESTMPATCCHLIELTRETRNMDIPIYILSKNSSEYNMVYLQLGVEACFSVEIYPDEFCKTLTNLLNHYYPFSHQESREQLEDKTLAQTTHLKLIPENLSVIIDGKKEVNLTKIEFQIMGVLCDNPYKTVSYADFMKQVWSNESDGTVRNYKIANAIFHIRNKIEKNPKIPRFIKTVRSKGYMLSLN
ncbi:TPA: response regulator transcription factor [Enterococcus faecalis]|nr:response regulator transcription factor [Enterococcus faecalis]HBI1786110.1 response regulator transcription factor [Enterococcus faecalis]HBI1791385.1 response regulator transcription factor [Enterococcus faecalis]HBI1887152.1 response regulator transcription factor [Enterococcus faecalis]HBI1897190.1 response regulator transcription factor [Enterococcus faecalis]